MFHRAILYFIYILLFVFGLPSQVVAQLPSARITAIFPMGCEVGGVTEVKVYGSDLEGATGLYFSRAGISGKLLSSSEQKFQIKVEPEVPSGVYEVRFVGALGVEIQQCTEGVWETMWLFLLKCCIMAELQNCGVR